MKNQKGITLIALIITIIVMLILVAVTVTTVVNSGIFKHAGDATSQWSEKQNEEEHIDEGIKDNEGTHGINAIVNKYTPSETTPDSNENTPS